VWSQGYVDGDVSNENVDVTIKFPQGLVPDNTDSVMENVKVADGEVADSTSFKNGSYDSHVYRFFVTGDNASKKFSLSDFAISFGGYEVVQIKTPE
jgi:hypothetical protein